MIAIVVAAVVGIVLLVVLAIVALSSITGRQIGEDLDKPPSQRHGSPTSDSAASRQNENPDEEIAGGGVVGGSGNTLADKSFRNVRCTFSGSSTLDPGLSESLLAGPSVQKMELKPGASFKCTDEFGSSSGKVSMSAKFPALTALRGAGVGSGLIEWETLPPDAPGAPEPGVAGPRKSTTHNEVELALPQIIVWITIVDGPYAGRKGKLVLNDWELVKDIDGTIVEVRFQPTDFEFAIP